MKLQFYGIHAAVTWKVIENPFDGIGDVETQR